MTNRIYHVEFPNLGLKFDISPVAFSLFGLKIYWYGILIALGFTLAVLYAFRLFKKKNIDTSKMTDVVFVGLISAIIGARLYYVIFYPSSYFWDHSSEIFAIHDGGLAIYGGLIGALIGGCITLKIKKLPLLPVLDICSIGFLIGQGIGRWGNFTNQEAFGTQTDSLFEMMSEATSGKTVHPCFLYESCWCLLGVLALHIFYSKFHNKNGFTFCMYFIWYGTERFFLEAIRTDSLYLPHTSIKISQLVALATIVLAICAIIYLQISSKRRQSLDSH